MHSERPSKQRVLPKHPNSGASTAKLLRVDFHILEHLETTYVAAAYPNYAQLMVGMTGTCWLRHNCMESCRSCRSWRAFMADRRTSRELSSPNVRNPFSIHFHLIHSHSLSKFTSRRERCGEMTHDDLGTLGKGTEYSHAALRERSFVLPLISTVSTASWHRMAQITEKEESDTKHHPQPRAYNTSLHIVVIWMH